MLRAHLGEILTRMTSYRAAIENSALSTGLWWITMLFVSFVIWLGLALATMILA